MRRTASLLVTLLASLALVGCCADGTTRAGLMAAPAMAAAPCPAGCQPVPSSATFNAGPTLVANQGTYQLASPVGVEYRVGAREYAKAGFTIPANIISCGTTFLAKGLVLVGETAHCITDGIFPEVVPTQRLLYAQPAAAPASANPCAPTYAVPTPKAAPCPPPVAVIPPMPMPPRECEGGVCDAPTTVATSR